MSESPNGVSLRDGPRPGYAQALLASDREQAVVDGPMLAAPEVIARSGKGDPIDSATSQYGPLAWIDRSTIIGWIGGTEGLAIVRTDARDKSQTWALWGRTLVRFLP